MHCYCRVESDYLTGSAADGDGAGAAAGAGSAGAATGAGPGSATGTRCCVSETLPPEQLEHEEAETVPQPDWQCWCGLTHFGFGQRTFGTRTCSHFVQHLLMRALASSTMKPNTMVNAAILIINFFNIHGLPI